MKTQKKVITISGNLVSRNKTRKFSDKKFYEIGVDCVKLNNKYWRIGKSVVFDHNKNKYDFKKNLVYGFIGLNKKGYFSINNKTVNITDTVDLNEYCLSKYIAIINNFTLSYGETKLYIHKSILIRKMILQCSSYYNVEENSLLLSNYSNFLNDYLSRFTKNRYFKYTQLFNFHNYKYGIEYETSNGSISTKSLEPLGLIPLRDGSLKNNYGQPLEYATCIIDGENLISAITNQCYELKYHCDVDHHCSVHLHISCNKPFTDDQICILYQNLLTIQKEIVQYFPKNRVFPKEYIENSKEYCKLLPVISQNFSLNTVAKVFADPNLLDLPHSVFTSVIENKNAPSIRKWHNPNRYYWVNLYNLFFKNSQTVEFRIHEGSFEKKEIINWSIICTAIVFSAQNSTLISSFDELLNKFVNPQVLPEIKDYLLKRKTLFATITDKKQLFNYLTKNEITHL